MRTLTLLLAALPTLTAGEAAAFATKPTVTKDGATSTVAFAVSAPTDVEVAIVDVYGRIYYPTGLLPRVSVIDNEGNPVLSFGTYGNRDSTGGLPGDLVPTTDVPLGWPSSVDATDEHIVVTDVLNIRVLRLAKSFIASETAPVR